jgi:hypothetical protein
LLRVCPLSAAVFLSQGREPATNVRLGHGLDRLGADLLVFNVVLPALALAIDPLFALRRFPLPQQRLATLLREVTSDRVVAALSGS